MHDVQNSYFYEKTNSIAEKNSQILVPGKPDSCNLEKTAVREAILWIQTLVFGSSTTQGCWNVSPP